MESSTLVWMVVALLIYLGLNVLGTVYYLKLKNDANKPVGLVTVILGWLLMPLLNITSPILYAQESEQRGA